jgi:quercetin dioxygenase-like cupin family protein
VRYFRREELRPLKDCAGVRHWGVALDKAMLTFFEVDPNTRFAIHRHDSEQITLVLEGTLFFELDGAATAVNEGEVIAIPSRVPHTAFTRASMVKAVDAWSPVVAEFERRPASRTPLPDFSRAARARLW